MPNIAEEIEGFMDNFREYKNFEYKFQQVFCLIQGVENAIHVEVALLLIIFFLSFLFFFGVSIRCRFGLFFNTTDKQHGK